MHEVVEAFGLTLRHEPWPLWAHRAASLPLLAALVMQLRVALWRRRIQKRVIGGGRASGPGLAGAAAPRVRHMGTGCTCHVAAMACQQHVTGCCAKGHPSA